MATQQQRVGLVGTGAMGEPMGMMLIKRGFKVTTTAHRNQEPALRLAAAGAQVVATPADVAAQSDVVVVCVPDAPQVEAVVLGESGIVTGARRGLVVIDMSTIAPLSTRRIGASLAEHGVEMLDAPVSGGPTRAKTGELTIMVGGDSAIVERCRPVLQAMGTSVIHVGPLGQGEVVKLANNVIAAVVMTVLGEALTLGVKGGADAQVMREVMLSSSGSNYLLDKWIVQNVLVDEYRAGFATELMHKDLAAALDTARELGVPMPITALAQQLYRLVLQDHARDDYSAVTLLAQEAANVSIATGRQRQAT
ncbi:MAG: 2-hydroxy-3-oxopropionate reductase [Herpetosiphon sp.]